jgi:hypothetical protein
MLVATARDANRGGSPPAEVPSERIYAVRIRHGWTALHTLPEDGGSDSSEQGALKGDGHDHPP